MVTANELFEKCLCLMGEETPRPGDERRAIHLINILLAENDELNRVIRGETLSENHAIRQITSLSDPIDLEDILVFSLLPFGLCYLMLNETETDRAAFFMQCYANESAAIRKRYCRGRSAATRDVYFGR